MQGSDSQVVELLGRNRLIDELLQAGLEIALPMRDRGIDLIAYVELAATVETFTACPIQMKASSRPAFGLHSKYRRVRNLIIAHVWYVQGGEESISFATTYDEALSVADSMGWTSTPSWKSGAYSTSHPSKRLRDLLEPFRMTPAKWRAKVVQIQEGSA